MLRNNVHELATNGQRANKDKIFHIELTGAVLYTLKSILEKVAVESKSYIDIANAVQCNEYIWDQAKEQGF